ncbi:hypothetical protein [Saccharicrinis aurantiacus]|uniref:hypothetical protein n=1 Tax=Saccharicrinis aurantiacus TaxID=1849719 RepID=UPI0024900BE9|nr:hypothetical protein [Saccharicrinis aurantiacus]
MKLVTSSTIFSLLALLIFTSCGPNPTEEAMKKYNKAVSLFQDGSYNSAKLVIDTLLVDYESEIEYVVKAENLLREIKIDEQKRNLLFLDTALQEQQVILDKLMKNFIISKEYGSKEVLIHKRQKPQNSYNRIYLRAHLDYKGNFYISSRYSGDHYINHKQIRVYNQGQSVISSEVSPDGFNNRKFEDSGSFWEVVNYKDGKDNGIIDFIAQNTDKPLKAVLIGKEYSYIVLEKFDKEAIRDGYEISFVLKEITSIKEQISNVNAELKRLM